MGRAVTTAELALWNSHDGGEAAIAQAVREGTLDANGNVRLPPHDPVAEMSLVGYMAVEGASAADEVFGSLRLRDFYRADCRAVATILRDMRQAGAVVFDEAVVKCRLIEANVIDKARVVDFLVALVSQSAFAAGAPELIARIRDRARHRDLIVKSEILLAQANKPNADLKTLQAIVADLEDVWIDQPREQFRPRTAADLCGEHPVLRPPLVYGINRIGEVWNLIATSKAKKSWLLLSLALSIATGRRWLGRFQCTKGRVLLLDNELHPETLSYRLRAVADALDIDLADVGDSLMIDCLRGRPKDVGQLGEYLAHIPSGHYQLIALDAWYRFQLEGHNENDNAQTAAAYNEVDSLAQRLESSFLLVHHLSKGNQSGKSVVDSGAGAGAQSRAADSHVVIREHEEDGVCVFDSAVRSWEPFEKFCMRWRFPLWVPADELDPERLKPERTRQPKAKVEADQEPAAWDPSRFIAECVTGTPEAKETILDRAKAKGLTRRAAVALMDTCETEGAVFRWSYGSTKPRAFCTIPQTTKSLPINPTVCVHTPPLEPPLQCEDTSKGLGQNGRANTQTRSKA